MYVGRFYLLVAPLAIHVLINWMSASSPGAGADEADNNNGSNGTTITTGIKFAPCTVVTEENHDKTIKCPDGSSLTVSNEVIAQAGDQPLPYATKEAVEAAEKAAASAGRVKAFAITKYHGKQMLDEKGYREAGKFIAKVEITGATASAAGEVNVNFKVSDANDNPVKGIASGSFNIVKLIPATNDESYNYWVPYIYRTAIVKDSDKGDWPNPDGTIADQANKESDGTLVDNKDGSYSYTFKTNIGLVKTPTDKKAIKYDRKLTHRVSVMLGGHSGPTGDDVFDFVPDGSKITEKRNIIDTTSCRSCHGEEFHGHGGNRRNVDTCVTCHLPGNVDPQGGESLDFPVMIHKIHSGMGLPSTAGPDGIVWDDLSTTDVDESADNKPYTIWGHSDHKATWWKSGYPAVIENCEKCHSGEADNVDNWKNVPSRKACGSCHDDVNFADGTNHEGGVQASDKNCAGCHIASGTPEAITEGHAWTTKDERNTPEFDVELTMSTPANGTHYVNGESPLVTLVLKENGVPIDHTKVVKAASAQGCVEGVPCPARDGLFSAAKLMVHGPRSRRNPVLTLATRVEKTSSTVGPFVLGTEDTLTIIVDGGKDIYSLDSSGGDVWYPGSIPVDVDDGNWATEDEDAKTATATAAEVVAWLNADSRFKARAVAELDSAGKVVVRTRNLGDMYSLQFLAGDVNTAIFGGDVSIAAIGGSSVSVQLYKAKSTTTSDPRITWTTGSITYQLDAVDNLKAGTYVASVEIADIGRKSGTEYKTPSIAKTLFQVKQADEELPIAGNCKLCHQGADGRGLIFDPVRHRKVFDGTAIDQCTGCHDYQNGAGRTPNSRGWVGALPIGYRVHAVHMGSDLHTPNTTVSHSDEIPARHWDIKFPQDIRNCETCHDPATTSGSWKSKPSRIPCSGCHDSQAAQAHFVAFTADRTPADPWSGDEVESCAVCH